MNLAPSEPHALAPWLPLPVAVGEDSEEKLHPISDRAIGSILVPLSGLSHRRQLPLGIAGELRLSWGLRSSRRFSDYGSGDHVTNVPCVAAENIGESPDVRSVVGHSGFAAVCGN
jgi:hypothetical protein